MPWFFQRSMRDRCWRAVPRSTPRSWQARLVSASASASQHRPSRANARVALGVCCASMQDTSPVRIVPRGGLGEVGMNCLLVETEGGRVVVDCGVLFPGGEAALGVEVIAPDLTRLEQAGGPDAVLLTHAHEDHVGALPYLLREWPHVPVYGARFTLGVVKEKIAEHGISADLRELPPGTSATAGGIGFESIQVTHSVPDAVGYAIRPPGALLVHTSDS